jgi:acetyl/propionyl-CoA carboxylase alpha subunit
MGDKINPNLQVAGVSSIPGASMTPIETAEKAAEPPVPLATRSRPARGGGEGLRVAHNDK